MADHTAPQHATFLRALADHLDTHPHLKTVNINRDGASFSLQIVGDYGDYGDEADLTDLSAWATSLDLTHLQVRHIIAGRTVHVWVAVPADDYAEGTTIPVEAQP